MTLPRRGFLYLTAGAVSLPAASRFVLAQAYPSRPVRIIVGFGAGGAPDILARLMGQWLSERLGQQFMISGTESPRALAVFRLMTSSNLIGACTGSSPGLSPFSNMAETILRPV
jgi:hypothetical protein